MRLNVWRLLGPKLMRANVSQRCLRRELVVEQALDQSSRQDVAVGHDWQVETPAFVYDEEQLRVDARGVRAAVGPQVRLLLAMKAFTIVPGLRVLAGLVDGLHASSLFETELARCILGPEGFIHMTTPGLRPDEVGRVCELADYVSFNSLPQWRRYHTAHRPRSGWGLRVNPLLSVARDSRYDPCGPIPKLGTPLEEFAGAFDRSPEDFDGLDGLLVHGNCEGVDCMPLLQTVDMLEERLDPLLSRLSWIDLGGGYLFQEVCDLGPLHEAVGRLRARGLEVIVEPGSALVSGAGYLVATVLDVFTSGGQQVAVLDTSVNHIPEAFEYDYSPDVAGARHAGNGDAKELDYLLAGSTCLAGDVFGRYSFPTPLSAGSRVVFTDVGAYSMVKAHWFNGVNLPTIYALRAGGPVLVRRFTYSDFLMHSGGSDAFVRGQLRREDRSWQAAAGTTGTAHPAAVPVAAAADKARRQPIP